MTTPIDIGILELLASKICHDLISPIGAVNNGIEFLEEMGPDAGKEVTDLIAFSAGQASAKLKAYRMAYGSGGGDSSIKPEEVHAVIESIVGAEKKIRQDWDPHAKLGPDERPNGYSKMLVCALLLAMESLPKGGVLSVKAGANGQTLIRAEGENAGMRDGAASGLDLSMKRHNIEPKFVHAYMTGLMASHYEFKIAVSETGSKFVVFTLTPP